MSEKISTMVELLAANANTWMEVLDLDEADPTLQNKKMKHSNVNNDSHVQNTDQYLDFGGPSQVAAGEIARQISIPPAFNYLYATGSAGEGDVNLSSMTGTGVLTIGNLDNAAVDQSLVLAGMIEGSHIYIKGRNTLALARTTGAVQSTGSAVFWDVSIVGSYGTFNDSEKVELTVVPYFPVLVKQLIRSPLRFTAVSDSTPPDGDLYLDGFGVFSIGNNNQDGLDVSAMLLTLPVGTHIYMQGQNGAFVERVTVMGTQQIGYVQFTVQGVDQEGTINFGDDLVLTIITP